MSGDVNDSDRVGSRRESPRVLLTGAPRSGKTTLVTRIIAALQLHGVAVHGFTTRELREAGERVGFLVEAIGGDSAVMAHVSITGGPRVGRYGVDVAAFERIALPALRQAARPGMVTVIDELGQMELYSSPFVEAVQRLFARDMPVVATVHATAHPVTDALKRRRDVELLTVTRSAHDELFARVTARLLSGLGGTSSPDQGGEPQR